MASKLAFLALLATVLVAPCVAQISPEEYVKLHNAARVGVGIEPVTWDDTVAAWAQNYAEQRRGDCALVHSPVGRPYGENLAMGPAGADTSASTIVGMWVAEKQYYDYAANSCTPGQMCGHYTQVVWRNTKAIGCASVACNNGGTFIICSYDPPGNVPGERPY